MDNMFSLKALTAAMLVAGSGSALALDPAPVKFAGMEFTPTLKVTEAHDDNIRALGDGLDESSWITTVNPTFELAAKDRLNVYSLRYSLNSKTYHSTQSDNHVDHHVDLNSHLEFNDRNRLDLNAGYDKVEVVGDTQGGVGINDKFHSYNVGGVYGFGAQSAAMQLELAADQVWLRYDNDQVVNGRVVNSNRERDMSTISGTAYYRVASKTRALAEVRYRDFDYQMKGSTLNNDATSYLMGVTWDATAKTTGTAKIGYTKKKYDDAGRDDATGSVWQVGVNWQPLTYSTFSLNTSRDFEEGYEGAEDAIDTTRTGINWNHAWSAQVSTDVGYTYIDEQYEYSTRDSRDDKTDQFRVGLTWNVQRWLDLGVSYSYEDVDSTSPIKTQSYDRNIFMVSVNMSL